MMYNGLYNNNALEIMYQTLNYSSSNTIEMTQEVSGSNLLITINGVQYTKSIGTNISTKNMLIFGCYSGSGALRMYTGTTNCYYFKIKVGSEVIRDYMPCYKISTGEVGLYDKINNKFYKNAGTGTFTKGPDVN